MGNVLYLWGDFFSCGGGKIDIIIKRVMET